MADEQKIEQLARAMAKCSLYCDEDDLVTTRTLRTVGSPMGQATIIKVSDLVPYWTLYREAADAVASRLPELELDRAE